MENRCGRGGNRIDSYEGVGDWSRRIKWSGRREEEVREKNVRRTTNSTCILGVI